MFNSVKMNGNIIYWLPDAVNPCPSDYHGQIAIADHLTTVSCRISDCNRIRLVAAEYNNDNASASCVALRDTHFSILLFRGETQKEIIVVIRKISGCDLIFREEYEALMNAAVFGEIMPRMEDPKPPTEDKPSQNNEKSVA